MDIFLIKIGILHLLGSGQAKQYHHLYFVTLFIYKTYKIRTLFKNILKNLII
jgi:hypothetical protein